MTSLNMRVQGLPCLACSMRSETAAALTSSAQAPPVGAAPAYSRLWHGITVRSLVICSPELVRRGLGRDQGALGHALNYSQKKAAEGAIKGVKVCWFQWRETCSELPCLGLGLGKSSQGRCEGLVVSLPQCLEPAMPGCAICIVGSRCQGRQIRLGHPFFGLRLCIDSLLVYPAACQAGPHARTGATIVGLQILLDMPVAGGGSRKRSHKAKGIMEQGANRQMFNNAKEGRPMSVAEYYEKEYGCK